MRKQVWLFTTLLLAATAAGCLGGDGADDAQDPVGAAGNTTQEGGDAATNATTGFDASESQNADGDEVDPAHQPHIHDYWKGKERVTLMDEDVTTEPEGTLFMTFLNTFMGTPGAGGAFLELPQGALVYEGTGTLEFTATWTEPTITGLAISYRSAESNAFSDPLPLTSGEALTIDVTPGMADMPHAKTSEWAFWLRPADAGQVVSGTIHVRVDVVKMDDVMEFPAHPELFGGADTLTILDGSGTSTQSSFPVRLVNLVAGAEEDQSLPADKVVPMETLAMTANLTITSATAGAGEVTDVYLLVKTADAYGYRPARQVGGDLASGTLQFAWSVDMRQTDSPYADESAWRFDVRASTDPTGAGTNCGGCTDAEVQYDLVVVAHASEVEGAEPLPDWGRGGDDDEDAR